MKGIVHQQALQAGGRDLGEWLAGRLRLEGSEK